MSVKKILVPITAISKGCPFPDMERVVFDNPYPKWDKRNWTKEPELKRLVSNKLQIEQFLNRVSRSASTKTKWWLKYVLVPYLINEYDKVEKITSLDEFDDYGEEAQELFKQKQPVYRVTLDTELENLVKNIVFYLNNIARALDSIKFSDVMQKIIDQSTRDSLKKRNFLDSVKVHSKAISASLVNS